MLLPDRNMPPPGSPPPKTPAELVQAIQRFGMLATDARHAEIARIIQGLCVVAAQSDAALAQRNLELEGRVATLEQMLPDVEWLKGRMGQLPASLFHIDSAAAATVEILPADEPHDDNGAHPAPDLHAGMVERKASCGCLVDETGVVTATAFLCTAGCVQGEPPRSVIRTVDNPRGDAS